MGLPAHFPEDWRLAKLKEFLRLKIWRYSFKNLMIWKQYSLSFSTPDIWCIRLKMWWQHALYLNIQYMLLCAGCPWHWLAKGNPPDTGNEIYPWFYYSSVYLSQTLINPGDKRIQKAISHANHEVLINRGFYTSSPERHAKAQPDFSPQLKIFIFFFMGQIH